MLFSSTLSGNIMTNKQDLLKHVAVPFIEKAIFEEQCRNVREVSQYIRHHTSFIDFKTLDQLIHAVATQYKQ